MLCYVLKISGVLLLINSSPVLRKALLSRIPATRFRAEWADDVFLFFRNIDHLQSGKLSVTIPMHFISQFL